MNLDADIEYGTHILKLPFHVRTQLLSLESERISIGLDEEQFFADRLRRSGLTCLTQPKKTTTPDGGVDFAVRTECRIFIGQLKWWRRPLTLKLIKDVFGEMFFNELTHQFKDSFEIHYLLVSPLINKKALEQSQRFAERGYSLVCGSDFIQFMSNPHYYLNYRMEVAQ